MNVINPITIDDDVFIGSNVPEDDEQVWANGSAYVEGDDAMVTTGAHKTYEALAAQNAGLAADLLDEDCSDISDWIDNDSTPAVSEVSPAGQFKFDTKLSAAGNNFSSRAQAGLVTLPSTITLEIKTYFDAIGTYVDNDYAVIRLSEYEWAFRVYFCSDGLFISKANGVRGEVGEDIVKCNANAAWQTFRFQINKTTESAATVEVFLKEEGGAFISQGTFDCNYVTGGIENYISYTQFGNTTDNRISHIDYIKIGTGHGMFSTTNDSPVGNTNWLDTGSANRWKCFNAVLGSQTEQATKIEYIIKPGETFDSLALLNMASDTVDIVVCDMANDLITNGTDWTGATGTTQPASWDKVGTPADFSIGYSVAYTSDFSAEEDGFIAARGVVAGNIDSIGGQNDCLRFTCSNESATHSAHRYSTMTVGKEYTISFDYYIPLGQSNIDGLILRNVYWGGTTTQLSTLGEWVSVTKHFTANSSILAFHSSDGGEYNYTDAGGDDVFYIRNIKVYEGRRAVKITSDANGEGISETITVSAATEYQLCGLYKNTSGDVAQYAIYDVTHSANIVAATDLPDATDFSSFSNVFTTPAGCTSIKISLLAKTAGDIVWFDSIVCAPTDYSDTVTTGTNIKSVNKTDIPGTSTSLITLTANKSGTVKIGELIVGNKTYIGVGPLEDAQGGFTNYSDFSENQFGEIELVSRSYSKKLSFDVDIDYADIDSIYDFLCDQKDTMMLYLGSETYGALQIYGFCKEPVITYHSTYCTMALEIRGVI